MLKANRTKGAFLTHFSAGLLTTALAALLWSTSPLSEIYVYAFCLFGLTHGIAIRRGRVCLFGLASSAAFLTPVFLLFPRLSWVHPRIAWGLYGFCALAALHGAAVPIKGWPMQKRVAFGTCASIVTLVVLGIIFRAVFPPRLTVVEVWELLTVLSSVPVIAFLSWWPVDMAIRKTEAKTQHARRS